LRKALLGSYVLSLVAMAFLVLVWPMLTGFDGEAGGMRSGHLVTLSVYLGVIAILCVLRVRRHGNAR